MDFLGPGLKPVSVLTCSDHLALTAFAGGVEEAPGLYKVNVSATYSKSFYERPATQRCITGSNCRSNEDSQSQRNAFFISSFCTIFAFYIMYKN